MHRCPECRELIRSEDDAVINDVGDLVHADCYQEF